MIKAQLNLRPLTFKIRMRCSVQQWPRPIYIYTESSFIRFYRTNAYSTTRTQLHSVQYYYWIHMNTICISFRSVATPILYTYALQRATRSQRKQIILSSDENYHKLATLTKVCQNPALEINCPRPSVNQFRAKTSEPSNVHPCMVRIGKALETQ